MKIAVLYHRSDFDGLLSREVCRHTLSVANQVHFYGYDYGDPTPTPFLLGTLDPVYEGLEGGGRRIPSVDDWAQYEDIYIVDLSVDSLMSRPELREKIVWIDHHKSAIDKWDLCGNDESVRPFKGLRLDGVAACRLCWQYFNTVGAGSSMILDLYRDRKVEEPLLLTLAGEYDIWNLTDPRALPLQFGLRTLSDEQLREFAKNQFDHQFLTAGRVGAFGNALELEAFGALEDLIKTGITIKAYCDKQNREYATDHARTLEWEGLKFCALNIGQRGNSKLLDGGLKPEHQACFAWRYTGDAVMVSLYHVPGHEDIDLSAIAKRYGGGGHRGACGFRITLQHLALILGSVETAKDGSKTLFTAAEHKEAVAAEWKKAFGSMASWLQSEGERLMSGKSPGEQILGKQAIAYAEVPAKIMKLLNKEASMERVVSEPLTVDLGVGRPILPQ